LDDGRFVHYIRYVVNHKMSALFGLNGAQAEPGEMP
jgi:hypothetical protein